MKKVGFWIISITLLAWAAAIGQSRAAWTYEAANGQITDGNWRIDIVVSTGNTATTEGFREGGGVLDLTHVYEDTGIQITRCNNSAWSSSGGSYLAKSAISGFIGNAELTVIGKQFLYQCENLTSVVLGDNVTNIGESAFSCGNWSDSISAIVQKKSSLTNVVLSAKLEMIGKTAFFCCTNLTSVTPFLPYTVNVIGQQAFFRCPIGGKLTLASPNLSEILPFTFYTNLITEVEFNEGLVSIGSSAFAYCLNLTTITKPFPSTFTVPGAQIFENCNALSGNMDLGACVELRDIPNGMFRRCFGITSVTLPPTVTNFAFRAFDSCSALVSVTAMETGGALKKQMSTADGVVDGFAFYNCQALETVEIPWGGETAFPNANPSFSATPKLTKIHFFGKAPSSDCGDFLGMHLLDPPYTVQVVGSRQVDKDGWLEIASAYSSGEAAIAPAGAFGLIEKPAERKAWLVWGVSPYEKKGAVLAIR